MDTIQLNKLYTFDTYSTIEVIKKTKKFITYRKGYLRRVEDENGVYTRNRIYEIRGDREFKTKLFVEDDDIYIKEYAFENYFKTNKALDTYHIFDDNKIIERKFV